MEQDDVGQIKLPYLQIYRDRYGHWRSYYRRSGRRQAIQGEIGSPAWLEEYQRIHASHEAPEPERPSAGSLGALAETYLAAPEFIQLRPSTREEYRRHIDPFRAKLGRVALIGITAKVVRAYRDALARENPITANNALRVIKTLLGYAVTIEAIEDNPALKIKPIRREAEGWRPWPEEALERFGREAEGAPRTAFYLALYTGQRRGDILAMRWDAIKDGGLSLRQAKTGTELWIPIVPTLQAELDRVRREQIERFEARTARKQTAAIPLTILAREDGRPYTDDGFAALWHREQHARGCAGFPFHGLRKNATIAMVEAGCNPQQVAAVTGHKTFDMIRHYSEQADQKRLAKEAMTKRLQLAAKDPQEAG